MAKGDVYYHLAPRERRASIRAEGIRTMSWDGARLVTWLIDGQQLVPAVAADILTVRDALELRGVRSDSIDVWQCHHLCRHRVGRCGSWIWYLVDIPSVNIHIAPQWNSVIKEVNR